MPKILAVEWPCTVCRQFINRNRAYRLAYYDHFRAWFSERHRHGAYCAACARATVAHYTAEGHTP